MNLILDQTYTDLDGALSTLRTALGDAWPESAPPFRDTTWADADPPPEAPDRAALEANRPADANAPAPKSDTPLLYPPRRTRHYVQLVMHEWLANLVRHAAFSEPPRVSVRVLLNQATARCEVTDNSRGFDLSAVLADMQTDTAPFPESGMGLRIIHACTTTLSYRRVSGLHHCFTASVPYDHDPWMNVLF